MTFLPSFSMGNVSAEASCVSSRYLLVGGRVNRGLLVDVGPDRPQPLRRLAFICPTDCWLDLYSSPPFSFLGVDADFGDCRSRFRSPPIGPIPVVYGMLSTCSRRNITKGAMKYDEVLCSHFTVCPFLKQYSLCGPSRMPACHSAAKPDLT